MNISLEDTTVIPTALMLTKAHGLKQWWQRKRIRTTLQMLKQTESILEPRDGQIEARGRMVAVKENVPSFLHLMINLSNQHGQKLSSSLFSFANALDDLGFKDEAIIAYRKLTSDINPHFHEAWNNLGFTYFSIKKYKEAVDSYQQAVNIEPDKYQSWDAMGIALSGQKKYQEAAEKYSKALEIKPDDWQTLYNRGNAFYYLKQDNLALADWQRAGEINPDLSQAFYNQACVYGRAGDVNQTLENLEKAIHINPERYKELTKKDLTEYFDAIKLDKRFQNLIRSL